MMRTFAGTPLKQMSGLESSSASLLLVYKSVLVCKQLFVEIVGTKLIPVEILQRQPAVKVGLTKLRQEEESLTASPIFRGLWSLSQRLHSSGDSVHRRQLLERHHWRCLLRNSSRKISISGAGANQRRSSD